jgi:hypothetical protein
MFHLSCACEPAVEIPHTGLTLRHIFIGQVRSQFELMEIKLKKKIQFFVIFGRL